MLGAECGLYQLSSAPPESSGSFVDLEFGELLTNILHGLIFLWCMSFDLYTSGQARPDESSSQDNYCNNKTLEAAAGCYLLAKEAVFRYYGA